MVQILMLSDKWLLRYTLLEKTLTKTLTQRKYEQQTNE